MREALADRLRRRPHAPVGIFPTPLQMMPRLSELLARPVYFKRDDLAGLAVGGSKIRVLQHTAGDALERGADLFVAGGYVQSNHPMQVAAVGCALGIPTEMVLDTTKGYEGQGNLLLTLLMGVKVHYVRLGSYEAIRDACARLAVRLERRGRRARLLTLTPEIHVLNALAYAEGFLELARQLEGTGISRADIFIGSGGPTYAGLVLGASASGGGLRVHGAPPRGIGAQVERVLDIARRAAAAVGLEIPLRTEDVSLLGRGEGVYGFTYPATMRTIRMVAEAEGVFLDPVYTGNVMAEMLDWLKARPGDGPVVFFHTGGVPALFAFERELMDARRLVRRPGGRVWRLDTKNVRRVSRSIESGRRRPAHNAGVDAG
jgi:D-cysteine desulfhydrase